MSGVTRAVAAMLRCSMVLMPAGRREWAEALRAEAAGIPPGRQQLTWLAGGVRLAVGEAARTRGPRYAVAFAAAAAGLAWSAWPGPPGDSAIVRNRVDVTAIAVILAGLPWLIRRARGPAAGGRLARLLRAGGYAAVLVIGPLAGGLPGRRGHLLAAPAGPTAGGDDSGASLRGGRRDFVPERRASRLRRLRRARHDSALSAGRQARNPGLAAIALAVAAFVVFVPLSAAVTLLPC